MPEIKNLKTPLVSHPVSIEGTPRPSAAQKRSAPASPSTPSVEDRPAPQSADDLAKQAAGSGQALARPGSKRKIERSPGSPKQASVLAFPDGQNAVVLPTFAQGAFAKVSSAALVDAPDAPRVVRKQRTFARVAHDANKIARRIDAAAQEQLLTPYEAESLKVDTDALSRLVHSKRALSLSEFRAIKADPRHLDKLVVTGRIDAETAIRLRVRHTERQAAGLAAKSARRLQALGSLPRPAAVIKKATELDDDGRWSQVARLDREGYITLAEASSLHVNPAVLKKLFDENVLTNRDLDKVLKNPWHLALLYQRGSLTGEQVVALRDTSADQARLMHRGERRLALLNQLHIKTQYRAASATAEERRLLRRVDSPLLPTQVAVVNGMEYELVKRFDGDARTLFKKPLPQADRAALVRALGLHMATELASAHQHGVAHLDMKPANVLVDSRAGAFVVGDWGLALEFVGDVPLRGLRGTPQYMAPEVLNNGDYRAAADVYSVGATLWMSAVGERALQSGSLAPALEERKQLETLLQTCADAGGRIDLARLGAAGTSGSALATQLGAWHALDPELANLVANHMLCLHPQDRLSMGDLVPKLQALMSPEVTARAQAAMQQHAPAAAPVPAEVVAETLDKT